MYSFLHFHLTAFFPFCFTYCEPWAKLATMVWKFNKYWITVSLNWISTVIKCLGIFHFYFQQWYYLILQSYFTLGNQSFNVKCAARKIKKTFLTISEEKLIQTSLTIARNDLTINFRPTRIVILIGSSLRFRFIIIISLQNFLQIKENKEP